MKKLLLFILFILPLWCFSQTNFAPQFKRNIPADSLLGYSIPGIIGNHWLADTVWIKKHGGHDLVAKATDFEGAGTTSDKFGLRDTLLKQHWVIAPGDTLHPTLTLISDKAQPALLVTNTETSDGRAMIKYFSTKNNQSFEMGVNVAGQNKAFALRRTNGVALPAVDLIWSVEPLTDTMTFWHPIRMTGLSNYTIGDSSVYIKNGYLERGPPSVGGLTDANSGLTNNAGVAQLGGNLLGDADIEVGANNYVVSSTSTGVGTAAFNITDGFIQQSFQRPTSGGNVVNIRMEDISSDASMFLGWTNSTTSASKSIVFTGSAVSGIIIEDGATFKGAVYKNNYGANFTARSLVDKGYVDSVATASSGSGITALTGDGTASGPGSAALILATVNTNVGSFGDATHVPAITVNAKGLTTAVTSTAITFPVTASNSVAFTNKSGNISQWTNDSGYITGNQTITLSGDVGGSGTTAITTIIGVGKVTNTMLAGSIAASKLIGTDITTVGTLSAGSIPYSLLTGTPSGLPPTGAAAGELAGTYPNPTVLNSAVIAKVLTGYTSGAGTVASTDNILQAIQKLNGNDALRLTNPLTTTGDIIYSSSGSTPARLAIGGANTVLHGGTTPGYSNVANADLANSTISGVALGSNLAALSAGTGLTFSNYTGAAAITAKADTSVLQSVLNFKPLGNTYWAQLTASNIFTGTLNTFQKNNIATTPTDAVYLQNNTASTSGAANQYSPNLHFGARVWNTTATAADNWIDWRNYVAVTSGTTPTSTLNWDASRSTTSTPSYTNRMNLTTLGELSIIAASTAPNAPLSLHVNKNKNIIDLYADDVSTSVVNAGIFIDANQSLKIGAYNTTANGDLGLFVSNGYNFPTITIKHAGRVLISPSGSGITDDASSLLQVGGNLAISLGSELKIKEGTNGFAGQTTLVSGTKAITITGVTTGSRAFVTLVSPSGTSLTTSYQAVCTSNTLTLQANVAAGTINIADGSVLNYFIVN